MAKLATALLALVTGYLVGAVGGYAAIQLLSANNHDRGVEAAMTGAFVGGPLVAIVALVAWIGLRKKKPAAPH